MYMYQHVYKKAMCVNIKERCLVCACLPCVVLPLCVCFDSLSNYSLCLFWLFDKTV